MTTVKTGLPERDATLELLNDAYGDWGDEAHFHWKYDEYPGFDPDEHCYYVERDGVAAFRRVFQKVVNVGGQSKTTYVLGDTAVGAEHRGEGMYSAIHDQTTEDCYRDGAEAVITFNNSDSLTFKANRKRGWNYTTIPLNVYIHSYSKVLSHYADLALEGDSIATRLFGAVSDRVAIQTSEGQIRLSEIFEDELNRSKRHLSIGTDPTAIARLVETVSNDSLFQVVPTGIGLLRERQIRPIGTPSSHESQSVDQNVTIESSDDISPQVIDKMVDLSDVVRAGKSSFRRQRDDIRHMLDYPACDIYLFRDGAMLAGYAVVGPYDQRDVREARVLDLVAPSVSVYHSLVSSIVSHTRKADYDLVVLLSEQNLDPEWAHITRQVMMWTEESSNNKLFNNPITISMYDVL